ncbi:hypothetical protein [Cohnella pontilimi]|uniref:hypothetical protein n=1 Tax=Cohnella pontilimi TaxID=2564100 RepID=UPI00145D939E|nr:hypothetical protein [Cohnella pontilimi]
MTSSRNHQEAHGIGQTEEQLNNQAEAADQIQGGSKLDREVRSAANKNRTELDEIIMD